MASATWRTHVDPSHLYFITARAVQRSHVFRRDVIKRILMDYIHNNPLQPHWRLAELPEEYVWSSAGFYLDGRRALIPLSDARELLV